MTYAEVSHDILAGSGADFIQLFRNLDASILSNSEEGVVYTTICKAAHLLELGLLARRNVDLGTILDVCRSNHCANSGTTASDDSYPGWSANLLSLLCSCIRTDFSLYGEKIRYSKV
jgi:hypothetical protein